MSPWFSPPALLASVAPAESPGRRPSPSCPPEARCPEAPASWPQPWARIPTPALSGRPHPLVILGPRNAFLETSILKKRIKRAGTVLPSPGAPPRAVSLSGSVTPGWRCCPPHPPPLPQRDRELSVLDTHLIRAGKPLPQQRLIQVGWLPQTRVPRPPGLELFSRGWGCCVSICAAGSIHHALAVRGAGATIMTPPTPNPLCSFALGSLAALTALV